MVLVCAAACQSQVDEAAEGDPEVSHQDAAVPAVDAAIDQVADAANGKRDAAVPRDAKPDTRPGPIPDAFLGEPQCQAGQYLLCEDFENGTLDSRRWTWSGNGGGPSFGVVTGVVDTARHARGRGAFHIKVA